MPLYTFECDGCGRQAYKEMTFQEHSQQTTKWEGKVELLEVHLVDDTVKICGSWCQVFDLVFKKAMPEHYNHTTDSFVRGEADFISDLHRKSDEMSARMGFDVAYEPVDGNDKDALGVTDDGLEETERRHVDIGMVEPKLYL